MPLLAISQVTPLTPGVMEAVQMAEPVRQWIDDNQAKVFVGIGLVVVLAFAFVVILWAPRPIDFSKLEALG